MDEAEKQKIRDETRDNDPVNSSGELKLKLLRFDCNFFPFLSGSNNKSFLKNCLLRGGQNV